MKRIVLLFMLSLITLGMTAQFKALPVNRDKCIVVLNNIVCYKSNAILDVLQNHPADINNLRVVTDGSLSSKYSVGNDIAVITVNTKPGIDISTWDDLAVVKGQVMNEAGEPLIGVIVRGAGEKSVACITDTEGNYNMILTDPSEMIKFEYVGFFPTLVTKEHAEHVIMTERPEMEDSGIVTVEVNNKEYNLE